MIHNIKIQSTQKLKSNQKIRIPTQQSNTSRTATEHYFKMSFLYQVINRFTFL